MSELRKYDNDGYILECDNQTAKFYLCSEVDAALTAVREEVENQRNKRKHEEELKLEAYEENGNLRAALQAVERERDDLASELALNASMLAEQCDLAR